MEYIKYCLTLPGTDKKLISRLLSHIFWNPSINVKVAWQQRVLYKCLKHPSSTLTELTDTEPSLEYNGTCKYWQPPFYSLFIQYEAFSVLLLSVFCILDLNVVYSKLTPLFWHCRWCVTVDVRNNFNRLIPHVRWWSHHLEKQDLPNTSVQHVRKWHSSATPDVSQVFRKNNNLICVHTCTFVIDYSVSLLIFEQM